MVGLVAPPEPHLKMMVGGVFCVQGQFDDDGDTKTECVDCPAGRFNDAAGATECAGVCANAGTYSAPGSDGAEDCQSCADGKFSAAGASSRD